MNNHFNNFIQALQSITMRDDSFARIRSTLSSYADLHTVSNAAVSMQRSPFMSFIMMRQTQYVSAFAFLIMFVGGGTIGAAERAVPGDALYSVKLNVTEKVSATFADTPIERAELATKLATRRTDEALKLMKEDKLDADTAAYLGSEVAAQVGVSSEAAAALEAEGNISASLAARTELADALASRVATLEPAAEASVAAEPMMMKTMMVADAAPVEENPRDVFIAALRVSADEVAEARTHTAAAFLPGIVDATLDLAALDGESEENSEPGVDAAAGTSLMMPGDVIATTTAETTFDARAKFAPSQNNAWPAGSTEVPKAFWIPEGR